MRTIIVLILVAIFAETATAGESYRAREDRLRDQARKNSFAKGWEKTQKGIRKLEVDDKREEKMARSRSRIGGEPKVVKVEEATPSNTPATEKSDGSHATMGDHANSEEPSSERTLDPSSGRMEIKANPIGFRRILLHPDSAKALDATKRVKLQFLEEPAKSMERV